MEAFEIEKHSPFRFNPEQRSAIEAMAKFLLDDMGEIFILHGHAGTGKTTILQTLIAYLRNKNVPVVLLASTGRAAKVVSEKALILHKQCTNTFIRSMKSTSTKPIK